MLKIASTRFSKKDLIKLVIFFALPKHLDEFSRVIVHAWVKKLRTVLAVAGSCVSVSFHRQDANQLLFLDQNDDFLGLFCRVVLHDIVFVPSYLCLWEECDVAICGVIT